MYQGPISIAYTLMILQQLYPDLIIQDHPLADWSAAYLRQANANIKSYPGPMVGSCGVRDDILCLLAIGAGSSKDRSLASELCDYAAEVLDPQSDNDWLSGRAGYLYLLRLVKVSFADDPDTLQLLADTQDDVVAAILEAPRPWRSRGRVQLGAVHGAIGIITQVVLTDPARYAARVEADLAVLLTYQYEGGNFPSLVPPDKDRLVQFCHGAPGVVLSLLSIRDHFPTLQDKITKAIERGRKCIWERGLLTKEPCICHGAPPPSRIPSPPTDLVPQASPATPSPSKTRRPSTSSPTPPAARLRRSGPIRCVRIRRRPRACLAARRGVRGRGPSSTAGWTSGCWATMICDAECASTPVPQDQRRRIQTAQSRGRCGVGHQWTLFTFFTHAAAEGCVLIE